MSITISSNFSLQTTLPLDSRIKVADVTARDAISASVRYEGLMVYAVSTGLNYQLVGGIANGNWTTLNTSGGGGGGGSLRWVEGASAPILSLESGLEVYAFTPALAQEIFTVVRVPTSYVAGNPITLKILWTCASTANNALLLAQATLIRSEVDDITSTTNQRTTTNSAITMAATNDLEPQKVSLDISSSIGEINAVAIAAGDLIKVRVYESSSTCADDIKLIPDASEVTFT